MKYSEFKDTYKKAIKEYPNIASLFCENDPEDITLVNTHYVKRGSRWVETDRKETVISRTHYINIVDPNAIKFFRNLGGYERVTKSYTKFGLLPIEVISINPDRTVKSVFRFKF